MSRKRRKLGAALKAKVALTARRQALVLTDGHPVGHLHWQIRPDGGLRMSSRNPSQSESIGFGHTSPPVFQPRQIGVWNFVCSTYDCTAGMSVHWINGKQVSSHAVESDLPIRIGAAEIGNWARPTEPVRHLVRIFVGRMDDLIVWGAALQPDEILEIYRSTRPCFTIDTARHHLQRHRLHNPSSASENSFHG